MNISAKPTAIDEIAVDFDVGCIWFRGNIQASLLIDHDPIRLNRIMISSLCLRMISAQTLRVCREENRFPLFRIML